MENKQQGMDNRRKGSWNPETLKIAFNKVMSHEIRLRGASEKYGIPLHTLFDKIESLKQGKEITLQPNLGRFTSIFTSEYEDQLNAYVKDLAKHCLPLTKKEFLKLAYALATQLKLSDPFSMEKGTVRRHFCYRLLARHCQISHRKAKPTSLMRAVSFNMPQVYQFFTNVEELMEKYSFTSSNIYNCDETGISCAHKDQKVLNITLIRQIGKLTSSERGKYITIVFCMSANGHSIPPFFIFPRRRINRRLMLNAPADSKGVAHRRLKKFVHPTQESPVLLILDGHSSHKKLDIITFCRNNNIHLISLPPDTSHKLQPLDRTFMKPFKNAFYERCDIWMRSNAEAFITNYDIVGLVRDALVKVARLDIAMSGFKCTGIYPLDKNIFLPTDYIPSQITDIPAQPDEESLGESTTRSSLAPNDAETAVAINEMDREIINTQQTSTSSATDVY